MTRKRRGGPIRQTISDDALWNNQRHTYADWSRLMGFHHKAIQQDALARGWKRNEKGEVIQAPCSKCNVPTPKASLSAGRQCPACHAANEQLDAFVGIYRQERAARLARAAA